MASEEKNQSNIINSELNLNYSKKSILEIISPPHFFIELAKDFG